MQVCNTPWKQGVFWEVSEYFRDLQGGHGDREGAQRGVILIRLRFLFRGVCQRGRKMGSAFPWCSLGVKWAQQQTQSLIVLTAESHSLGILSTDRSKLWPSRCALGIQPTTSRILSFGLPTQFGYCSVEATLTTPLPFVSRSPNAVYVV